MFQWCFGRFKGSFGEIQGSLGCPGIFFGGSGGSRRVLAAARSFGATQRPHRATASFPRAQLGQANIWQNIWKNSWKNSWKPREGGRGGPFFCSFFFYSPSLLPSLPTKARLVKKFKVCTTSTKVNLQLLITAVNYSCRRTIFGAIKTRRGTNRRFNRRRLMGWKGTGRAPGCRGGVNYCTIILALQALGAISNCCHVGNAFSHTVKKR